MNFASDDELELRKVFNCLSCWVKLQITMTMSTLVLEKLPLEVQY